MNGYGYALENDEFFESDESDEFLESDESDEFSERRRRGGRPPRINPGRTGRGTGLFKPRPAGGTSKFVTQAQLEAGLARVGKQISANSEAIKKVATQSNKINSELGAATSRLDKQGGELKKEVKKQGEASLLITLLQGTPQLEARTGGNAEHTTEVLRDVQVKKQDNLLPLILLSGIGGGGGLGGGDSSNMLLLALALSGKL